MFSTEIWGLDESLNTGGTSGLFERSGRISRFMKAVGGESPPTVKAARRFVRFQVS